MAPIRRFEILFADGKAVYFPGEAVKGTCIIDFTKEFKVKFIRAVMKAEARTSFTMEYSEDNEVVSDEVTYFTFAQVLHGSVNDHEESILDRGWKEFNFAFVLPPGGIDMSFDGEHGSINYWLEIDIVQKKKLYNKFRREFNVVTITDINHPYFQTRDITGYYAHIPILFSPAAFHFPFNALQREHHSNHTSSVMHVNYRHTFQFNKIPASLNAERTINCFWCESRLISLTAGTARTGFCPGENITIWAEFLNNSAIKVIPYATLIQIQTFYAKGNHAYFESKHTRVEGSSIGAYDTGSWDNMLLEIPALPPTLYSTIIKVEYFVKVALSLPFVKNVSVRIPITIGNVAYNAGPSSQPSINPQISASSTATNMNPQFPTPAPLNADLQFPMPIAPSDMVQQFPILNPLAESDNWLPGISYLHDGSHPSHVHHEHGREAPPPYDESFGNP